MVFGFPAKRKRPKGHGIWRSSGQVSSFEALEGNLGAFKKRTLKRAKYYLIFHWSFPQLQRTVDYLAGLLLIFEAIVT